jgi:hypothetical protein
MAGPGKASRSSALVGLTDCEWKEQVLLQPRGANSTLCAICFPVPVARHCGYIVEAMPETETETIINQLVTLNVFMFRFRVLYETGVLGAVVTGQKADGECSVTYSKGENYLHHHQASNTI